MKNEEDERLAFVKSLDALVRKWNNTDWDHIHIEKELRDKTQEYRKKYHQTYFYSLKIPELLVIGSSIED